MLPIGIRGSGSHFSELGGNITYFQNWLKETLAQRWRAVATPSTPALQHLAVWIAVSQVPRTIQAPAAECSRQRQWMSATSVKSPDRDIQVPWSMQTPVGHNTRVYFKLHAFWDRQPVELMQEWCHVITSTSCVVSSGVKDGLQSASCNVM